jgi:hypothetical protein
MRYFAAPTSLDLYSDFNPQECARRLREAIDSERPAVFSFSGYRGSKPFLGNVDGQQFRLLQRSYDRNSMPVVLAGEFQPHREGTHVKGTFDLEVASKIALSLLSAFFLLCPDSDRHLLLQVTPLISGCIWLQLWKPATFRPKNRAWSRERAREGHH